MSINKETLADKILPFLDTHVDATCTKCKNSTTLHQTDEYWACDELLKRGWYATQDNLYCPKCQKARLKKLKQSKEKNVSRK
jgi:DNA-directed RNA polymerase subunit RPC12/RpoP